jgi:hypothetical protein
MSSSINTKSVVVLTAGGVGRSKKGGKARKGGGTKTTPETPQPVARESDVSILDDPQQQQTHQQIDDSVLEPENGAVTPEAAELPSGGPPTGSTRGKSSRKAAPRPATPTGLPSGGLSSSKSSEFLWLLICFLGIMASFVCYGLLLEYATSGGRKLHELSFLFVTSGLYTMTAAAGRYVRDETPTTIPPARFAILGLTSMGSTFFSVRSLR